ncbi:hypothetical protein [Hymenobacter nivis]|uniref:hypothetical protein n=1 Tax=Hymenobacter nivis TaxID=1850093 RepID=UPI00112C8C04|nr:hypothetical protein [Hymenobacter nivis]
MTSQTLTARKSLKRLHIIFFLQKGKIFLSIYILTLSVLSIYEFRETYLKLNSFSLESKISNVDSLDLKPYPTWFYYDKTNKKIFTSKILSDSNKYQLLRLVVNNHKSYINFSDAVNKLAYQSNLKKPDLFVSLLLLTGWAAVIGVQIRTIFDFIGNVCYTKNLIITVWWPWYILRPILGFIIGSLVVFLTKSHLLNTTVTEENFTYITISTIAGFGIVEVVMKLRLISKALFGSDDDKARKA